MPLRTLPSRIVLVCLSVLLLAVPEAAAANKRARTKTGQSKPKKAAPEPDAELDAKPKRSPASESCPAPGLRA